MDTFTAIKNNDIEGVKKALEMGVDINEKDKNGMTALMWAARYGQTETVQLLIDNGADIDKKNNYDRTALNMAASFGHKEIVNLLNNSRKKTILQKI